MMTKHLGQEREDVPNKDTHGSSEDEERANLLEFYLLNYIWSRSSPADSDDLNLIKAGILIRSAAISCRLNSTHFSDVMASMAEILEGDNAEGDYDYENQIQTDDNDYNDTDAKEGLIMMKGGHNSSDDYVLQKTVDTSKEHDIPFEDYQPFGPTSEALSFSLGTYMAPEMISEIAKDENSNILLLLNDTSSFYERLTQHYRNYLNLRHNQMSSFILEKSGDGNDIYLNDLELNGTAEDLQYDAKSTETALPSKKEGGHTYKIQQQKKIVDGIVKAKFPVFDKPVASQLPLEEVYVKPMKSREPDVLLDFVEFFTHVMPLWSIPEENLTNRPPIMEDNLSYNDSSLSLSFASLDICSDQSTDLRSVSMDISDGWNDGEAKPLEFSSVPSSKPSDEDEELNSLHIRTSTPVDECNCDAYRMASSVHSWESSRQAKHSDVGVCHSREQLWDDDEINIAEEGVQEMDGVMPLNKKSNMGTDLKESEDQGVQITQRYMNHLKYSSGLLPNIQISQSGYMKRGIPSHLASDFMIDKTGQEYYPRNPKTSGQMLNHNQPALIEVYDGGLNARASFKMKSENNPQYMTPGFRREPWSSRDISSLGGANVGRVPLEPYDNWIHQSKQYSQASLPMHGESASAHNRFPPSMPLSNKSELNKQGSAIFSGMGSLIPTRSEHGNGIQHRFPPPVAPQWSKHQHQHVPCQYSGWPYQFNSNENISNGMVPNGHVNIYETQIFQGSQMVDGTGNHHHVRPQRQTNWPPVQPLQQQEFFSKMGALSSHSTYSCNVQQWQMQHATVLQHHQFNALYDDIAPWRKRRQDFTNDRVGMANNNISNSQSINAMYSRAKPSYQNQQPVDLYESSGTGVFMGNTHLYAQKERLQTIEGFENMHRKEHIGVGHIFTGPQQQKLRELARSFPEVSDVKLANDFQAMILALNS